MPTPTDDKFRLRSEYLQPGHPMRRSTINLIKLALVAHGFDFAAAAAELGCAKSMLYRLSSGVVELRGLRKRPKK